MKNVKLIDKNYNQNFYGEIKENGRVAARTSLEKEMITKMLRARLDTKRYELVYMD